MLQMFDSTCVIVTLNNVTQHSRILYVSNRPVNRDIIININKKKNNIRYLSKKQKIIAICELRAKNDTLPLEIKSWPHDA